MNGKQIVTTLDLVLHWIMRLAVVNGLWFLFSLRGLLIGGIFPATAAVLGLARKWLMGQEEVKLWKTFKQIYRQEFVIANTIGWILTIFGGLLYLNYKVIAGSGGEVLFIVPFAFYLLLFFYTIVALWVFPLMVHYKTGWRQYLKNALIIGVTKLHYTLAIAVVVFAVLYYSLEYPGMIPFFTISLMATGSMWLSMLVFRQLDQKESSVYYSNCA
ncbi:YesL family protein [Thalassobacillus pellis]|uniref:YesL family protein n=1 Tax=Thalassobacillus pellis TaxID=748008 RepID=UPI0019600FBA|nr:YesL family protein [Thalassobacillus pellis]MBM7553144.1 putative membrane protein YesL [Thalassobacillus pellis]